MLPSIKLHQEMCQGCCSTTPTTSQTQTWWVETMACFLIQSVFRLGVGRDLTIRQTYVQIVNFPNEVHTETPSKETRLIFVYSGLSSRDIIHNVPPSNSMVLIPSWSVQRSLVEVASKWPPPPHLHWWQLTSHFHNNQHAYWLVDCGYFP